MSEVSKRPSIQLPTLQEDKAITAAARRDPDAQPLTPKQLKAMVPIRAVRGRPKSENKKLLVSVRYSPEVIAYFRSTGEGWQGRMDGVLSEYVSKHATRRTPVGSTLIWLATSHLAGRVHRAHCACVGSSP